MKKIIFMTIVATFVFCSCVKEKNKEYVEFYELGIMIQQKDLGKAYWETADEMCRSSRVGGFSNWRLPTIGELAVLNQNREILENIEIDYSSYYSKGAYWSSSVCNYLDYYNIYRFKSEGGEAECIPHDYWSCNVRAVRNIE